MLKNSVLDIWKEGKTVINGWLSIPNSFTAEAMAKMGWDSKTIDMLMRLNLPAGVDIEIKIFF